MTDPITMARKFGASVSEYEYNGSDQTEIEFDKDQLAAFVARIRADARAEALEESAKKCDFEVSRLTAISEPRPALAVGICAAAIRSLMSKTTGASDG